MHNAGLTLLPQKSALPNFTIVIFRLGLLLKIENIKIMANLTPEIKSQASKYGLISAAIIITYIVITYIFSPFVYSFVKVFRFFVEIILLIISAQMFKKSNDGFGTFSQLFTVSFLFFAISRLIQTLFVIILFTFIDKDFGNQILSDAIKILNWVYEKMEESGTSAAQLDRIEEMIDKTENELKSGNAQLIFSVNSFLKDYFFGLIYCGVMSLVIAAFMKKDKPIFSE